MSAPYPRPPAGVHPVVLDRRLRDVLLVALVGFVLPLALALAISVGLPHLNLLLALAIIAGVVGVVALMNSAHLDVTVTILAVYLLILDGPVKLEIGSREVTAAVPDILIAAVCLGALLRMVLRRERVRMPPLSAWVLAFVGIVLIEAFNPKTLGILKVLGGFRQQLQWVPFFFFGYLLMRSTRRFRQLFIVICVCAVANAIVASYQSGLSPTTLASWGPGYRAVYEPATVEGVEVTKKVLASKHGFVSEGEAHVRPAGLGSDSGFSGGVGLVALPCALALLAMWRGWRRWFALVFALGSIVGIAMGLGRLQVIAGVLSVIAFIGFAGLAGRAKKPLAALAMVLVIGIPLGAVFITLVRSGTFARYASFGNSSARELVTHKSGSYTLIPHQLEVAPFGVGLGTVGAVGSFGGYVTNDIEGHTVSAESQYNLIADEAGLPGLLLWAVLSLYILGFMAYGMHRMRLSRDGQLPIVLAAVCAPFPALIISGFSGPFSTSAVLGPYFWFAIGVVAYWFAGHRRLAAPPR